MQLSMKVRCCSHCLKLTKVKAFLGKHTPTRKSFSVWWMQNFEVPWLRFQYNNRPKFYVDMRLLIEIEY